MFHHQMPFGDVPSNSEAPNYAPHHSSPLTLPPLDLSHIAPAQHGAALEYDSYLRQLTFNSKEMITSLTRIAGENMSSCNAIASTVEQRILHAPPMLKLPIMYLMDSIVKNIGANYIACFSTNLFHIFTSSYATVPPHVRTSMHRLLSTWPPFFGLDIVTAMHHAIADQDAALVQRSALSSMPQFLSSGQPMRMLSIPPSQPPQSAPMSHPSSFPFRNHVSPPAMRHSITPANLMTGGSGGTLPNHGYMSQVAPGADNRPRIRSQLTSRSMSGSPVGPMADRFRTEATSFSAQFLNTHEMMHEIIRKARLGTPPSNHQLFNMNRLITTQLQSASTPPAQRDSLLRFQQQLREAAAISHQTQTLGIAAPGIPSVSAANSVATPLSNGIPTSDVHSTTAALPSSSSAMGAPPALLHAIGRSQALSGLLRSIPPGLLATTTPGLEPRASSVTAPSFDRRQAALVHSVSPMGTAPSPQTTMRVISDVRQGESSLYQSPAPSSLKFSDLGTMSHAAAVRALYVELPYLSKSDGMRFASNDKLREHLDWVFQRNRRKRAIANKESLGGHSRCWFDSVKTFLNQGEADDNGGVGRGTFGSLSFQGAKGSASAMGSGGKLTPETDRRATAVPIIGDSEVCAACGETFETFWDDDQHSWMLADATRVDDDEVFHIKCLESTQASADHDYDEAGDEKKEEPKIAEDHSPKVNGPKSESRIPGALSLLQNSKTFVSTVKAEAEELNVAKSKLIREVQTPEESAFQDPQAHEGEIKSNESTPSRPSVGGVKRQREEDVEATGVDASISSAKVHERGANSSENDVDSSPKRLKVDDRDSTENLSKTLNQEKVDMEGKREDGTASVWENNLGSQNNVAEWKASVDDLVGSLQKNAYKKELQKHKDKNDADNGFNVNGTGAPAYDGVGPVYSERDENRAKKARAETSEIANNAQPTITNPNIVAQSESGDNTQPTITQSQQHE